MSYQTLFFNETMERPQSISYKNGILHYYLLPSEYDKPMEDAIIIVTEGDVLVAAFVCDGMGGHACANKATLSIYESIKKVFSSKKVSTNMRENILDAIELADQSIKDLKVGAGSTIVGFEVGEDFARSYHSGDSVSRILGSRGKIKYFSTEHSPRGHALESGIVKEHDVDKYVEDNIVSNGLGFSPMTLEVSQKIELNNSDVLFLSSDNIVKNFKEDQIIDFLTSGESDKRAEVIHAEMQKKIEDIKKDDTSMILFKYVSEKSNGK